MQKLIWSIMIALTAISVLSVKLAYEPAEVLDLTNVFPVKTAGETVTLAGGAQRVGKPIEGICAEVQEREAQLRSVKMLDLSDNGLIAERLDPLTDQLLPLVRGENMEGPPVAPLDVLVLSYNPLDEASAGSLLKWHQAYPEMTILLLETTFYGRYIHKLLRKVKALEENPTAFSQHIIFLTRRYVSDAEKRVRCYSDYIREGVLCQDWAWRHNTFFNGAFYKKYLGYKAVKKEKALFNSVKKMLSEDSSPPGEEGVSDGAAVPTDDDVRAVVRDLKSLHLAA